MKSRPSGKRQDEAKTRSERTMFLGGGEVGAKRRRVKEREQQKARALS